MKGEEHHPLYEQKYSRLSNQIFYWERKLEMKPNATVSQTNFPFSYKEFDKGEWLDSKDLDWDSDEEDLVNDKYDRSKFKSI